MFKEAIGRGGNQRSPSFCSKFRISHAYDGKAPVRDNDDKGEGGGDREGDTKARVTCCCRVNSRTQHVSEVYHINIHMCVCVCANLIISIFQAQSEEYGIVVACHTFDSYNSGGASERGRREKQCSGERRTAYAVRVGHVLYSYGRREYFYPLPTKRGSWRMSGQTPCSVS